MNYTIFNQDGKPIGNISSLRMTKEAAKSLVVQWFGVGSSVRVVK
ncbi:hypothetical protein [Neptunomonas japonica]|nr:hypothetical protein [Neptunomonas japonica]